MTDIERESLPERWVETTLGEVVTVISGVGFPHAFQGNRTGELPFYKVGDVSRAVRENDGRLEEAQNYVSREDLALLKGKAIPAGTVLFAKIGEAIKLNRRAIATRDCAVDNNVMGIIPTAAVNGGYLFRFMHTVDFSDKSRSTTVPSLRKSDVEEEILPLPPLPEQIRIAEKLDALLSRVDAGRERLERVPKLVKQLRQAVLSATVSGELTREWRGGGDAEWEEITLGHRTTKVGSGATPRGGEESYKENGIPLIRSLNVVFFGFKRDKLAFLDVEQARQLDNVRIYRNDILLNITGASIGRVTVVPDDLEGARVNQHVCIIRVDNSINSRFLAYYLSSPIFQAFVMDENTGTTRQALTKQQILALEIPLPPLPEQLEIVRRVEALFALADRLEQRYQSALASFERLTPALLAKAFRGELVPQDPADEPASVLLERIRAGRAAEGAGPKRGRKPGKAAGEDGAEPKRRGRPPKAQAEGAGETAEPKRRGRPPKARVIIPTAMNEEEAVRLLQERGQQRAEGARLVGLFEE